MDRNAKTVTLPSAFEHLVSIWRMDINLNLFKNPPSLRARQDWWDKSSVTWYFRGKLIMFANTSDCGEVPPRFLAISRLQLIGPLKYHVTLLLSHYYYCAYFLHIPMNLRSKREKWATRRTRGLVRTLLHLSHGGSSCFLWKRCVFHQRTYKLYYFRRMIVHSAANKGAICINCNILKLQSRSQIKAVVLLAFSLIPHFDSIAVILTPER